MACNGSQLLSPRELTPHQSLPKGPRRVIIDHDEGCVKIGELVDADTIANLTLVTVDEVSRHAKLNRKKDYLLIFE